MYSVPLIVIAVPAFFDVGGVPDFGVKLEIVGAVCVLVGLATAVGCAWVAHGKTVNVAALVTEPPGAVTVIGPVVTLGGAIA